MSAVCTRESQGGEVQPQEVVNGREQSNDNNDAINDQDAPEKYAQAVLKWRVCESKDGRPYYFNSDTQETSWDVPPGLKRALQLHREKGADQVWMVADAEWRSAKDAKGRLYYWKKGTKEVAWNLPQGAVPVNEPKSQSPQPAPDLAAPVTPVSPTVRTGATPSAGADLAGDLLQMDPLSSGVQPESSGWDLPQIDADRLIDIDSAQPLIDLSDGTGTAPAANVATAQPKPIPLAISLKPIDTNINPQEPFNNTWQTFGEPPVDAAATMPVSPAAPTPDLADAASNAMPFGEEPLRSARKTQEEEDAALARRLQSEEGGAPAMLEVPPSLMFGSAATHSGQELDDHALAMRLQAEADAAAGDMAASNVAQRVGSAGGESVEADEALARSLQQEELEAASGMQTDASDPRNMLRQRLTQELSLEVPATGTAQSPVASSDPARMSVQSPLAQPAGRQHSQVGSPEPSGDPAQPPSAAVSADTQLPSAPKKACCCSIQ